MRDAVERLLEVEEKAKHILQQARDEAAQIVADSRRRAEQIANDAAGAARSEAENVLRSRAEQAQKERQEILRAASQESPGAQRVDDERLGRAADGIVRVVAWAETGGEPLRTGHGPDSLEGQ